MSFTNPADYLEDVSVWVRCAGGGNIWEFREEAAAKQAMRVLEGRATPWNWDPKSRSNSRPATFQLLVK